MGIRRDLEDDSYTKSFAGVYGAENTEVTREEAAPASQPLPEEFLQRIHEAYDRVVVQLNDVSHGLKKRMEIELSRDIPDPREILSVQSRYEIDVARAIQVYREAMIDITGDYTDFVNQALESTVEYQVKASR